MILGKDNRDFSLLVRQFDLNPPPKEKNKTKRNKMEKNLSSQTIRPLSPAIRVFSRLRTHLCASAALFRKKWYYGTNLEAIGFLVTRNREREIESTLETKSDKIHEDSVQTLTPNTPKETPYFPIQIETALLQNVKQIPNLSPQQKLITFEQFKTLLRPHLEKRLTAIQEKFESFFKKSSKIVANIECCQNENTKH